MRTLAATRLAIVAGIVFLAACGGSELGGAAYPTSSTASTFEATDRSEVDGPQAITPDQHDEAKSESQSLTPPPPETQKCKKKGGRCSNPFECCSLFCGWFNKCT